MKKNVLINIVQKAYTEQYTDREEKLREQHAVVNKEYKPLMQTLRPILIDTYGANDYLIETNEYSKDYGFKVIIEKGQKPADNKYIRVYKNNYCGLDVYKIFTDKVDKAKILLTIFKTLIDNKPFPATTIERVLERYIQDTDAFEFFSKFEKNTVPTQLDIFFTKSKSYKDMKEYRLCKSYYGHVSKAQNALKQTSFSFSPAKVEIALIKNKKGEFIPALLFNLPVLSTLKFKYAIPMFSDDVQADIEELSEKFNGKFLKCITDIIGRAEKLSLKERKHLMTLPRQELIGRLKVAEMYNY